MNRLLGSLIHSEVAETGGTDIPPGRGNERSSHSCNIHVVEHAPDILEAPCW